LARLENVEALPVVSHRQLQSVGVPRQGHLNMLRPRMHGNILLGLLGDTKEAERHVRRKAFEGAIRTKLYRDSVKAAKLVETSAQCRG
jgi:hypothetical protein